MFISYNMLNITIFSIFVFLIIILNYYTYSLSSNHFDYLLYFRYFFEWYTLRFSVLGECVVVIFQPEYFKIIKLTIIFANKINSFLKTIDII